MSRIEQMREFIAKCPYMNRFSERYVDWTDSESVNYGIMPTGESILRIDEDVCGNKTKYKQANFALYARNFTIDDIARLESANFLEDFTNWIEEQSDKKTAPRFGDDPEEENMTAQNGMLFRMSENGVSGLYQIQIQCFFTKRYERND